MLLNFSKVASTSMKKCTIHRITSCFNERFKSTCANNSCHSSSSHIFRSLPVLQLSLPDIKKLVSSIKNRDMLQILASYNQHGNFECVLYKEPAITSKLNVFTFSKVLVQNVGFILKLFKMLYSVSIHISKNKYSQAAIELTSFCRELSKNRYLLLVYLYDKKCSFTRCLKYTISDRYNLMMYFFVVLYMLSFFFSLFCFFKAIMS